MLDTEPLSLENSSAADATTSSPARDDYLAFLSYRHADNTEEDQQWASWLHSQLEAYDIPADLIGTTNARGDRIPERLYPIFRDEVSLPADADMSSAIVQALDRSRFMIVLCSPRAVQSRYVNEEIRHFKRTGKADRIRAAILLGEPNASADDASAEDPEDVRTLECFPESLRYEIDATGALRVEAPTEPIAADFRLPDRHKGLTNPDVYRQQLLASGRSKSDAERLAALYEDRINTARLKLIAGILGVRLERLTERDKVHQLGKAREKARRNRLVAVVLGAATVVAGAGAAAAVHQWQKAERERERAETLLTSVRGNLEFMNFELREVMDRYVPQKRRIAVLERIDALVDSLERHGGLSVLNRRLMAVAFAQKADVILRNDALDPSEALPLLERARTIFAALVEQDPGNTGFQRDLSVSENNLGDIRLRLGETGAALEHYEAARATAQALVEQDPGNTGFQRDLSVSEEKLGRAYEARDDPEAALAQYTSALDLMISVRENGTLPPGDATYIEMLEAAIERLRPR